MAKSAKSSKPASRAPSKLGAALISNAALRMTALRVGVAVAVCGLGFALLMLNVRRETAARQEPARVVAAVAPPARPAPAPAPPAPRPASVDEAPTPAPPRRETSADNAKAMPAAMRVAFDAWLMGSYAKCWRAPKTLPDGDPYLPKVRVAFREDGELAAPPKLVNPPSDPAWRPHADAALKAVKGCDPLHVPDKYADYYPSWKSRTVYFDPTRN